MKKILILIVVFVLSLPAFADDFLSIDLGNNWDLVFKEAKNNFIMMEYVPKGETVNNWKKMITIQSFSGLQNKVTTKLFANNLVLLTKQSDNTLKYNIIKADDNDVIVQWSIDGNKLVDKQTEVFRVISGNEGLYVVHYAIKENPVSQADLDAMISMIESVSLKNNFPAK